MISYTFSLFSARMMFFTCLLDVSLLLLVASRSHHSYNTDDNWEDSRDCFYVDRSNYTTNKWEVTSYCIRQATVTNVSFMDPERCFDNELTFSQLKENNVTGFDLYDWSAPIDTINNYEKYLMLNNDSLSMANETYCNCTGNVITCQV